MGRISAHNLDGGQWDRHDSGLQSCLSHSQCIWHLHLSVQLHCRLWRALAEHALKARDFETAEKNFVRCAEYQV